MELYFIRHGIAADRELYARDGDRPLTSAGERKTANVAKRLVAAEVTFEVVFTSPLLRARQTAELLLNAQLSASLQEFAPLAPGGNVRDWVVWWQGYCQNRDRSADTAIALVGHQPDLGNWTETLVWGRTSEKLVVKKAGIIGVRIPDEVRDPIGAGELFLLAPPKWLLL